MLEIIRELSDTGSEAIADAEARAEYAEAQRDNLETLVAELQQALAAVQEHIPSQP